VWRFVFEHQQGWREDAGAWILDQKTRAIQRVNQMGLLSSVSLPKPSIALVPVLEA
jgi:hypothetical protein